jgi:hypothetical protein
MNGKFSIMNRREVTHAAQATPYSIRPVDYYIHGARWATSGLAEQKAHFGRWTTGRSQSEILDIDIDTECPQPREVKVRDPRYPLFLLLFSKSLFLFLFRILILTPGRYA